uniref:CULT domain-containing protein n=1 Tax=Chromera velia CCMP2878 TaxID=1169474 RepID=A0A0G4HV78_9ALVE|mmetsp:Transcript_20915/g.41711  ORF Transcript_20915/g.41711 Transcript_20915/m.41711 type:complete len:363 (+) Transcript_20915:299-1387(+)|eukprot:Cvel_8808.t1-p1 / transcript=Cvel_8808.t1 / gene=Cvel_8808 / organism=Chromera_velia_CCMP2878 / gene_product=hypothetical protein / transcript_product=hypothetical protein / location=Cvel_scaffold493:54671-58346(-) / protein_length=362 / sequence_SO=supercontig / SO=protein_coding / is_pseudo=false
MAWFRTTLLRLFILLVIYYIAGVCMQWLATTAIELGLILWETHGDFPLFEPLEKRREIVEKWKRRSRREGPVLEFGCSKCGTTLASVWDLLVHRQARGENKEGQATVTVSPTPVQLETFRGRETESFFPPGVAYGPEKSKGMESDVFAFTQSPRLVDDGNTFHLRRFETADVEFEGQPHPDSWFPGWGWRACRCPYCKAHVGWEFERIKRGEQGSTAGGIAEPDNFVTLARELTVAREGSLRPFEELGEAIDVAPFPVNVFLLAKAAEEAIVLPFILPDPQTVPLWFVEDILHHGPLSLRLTVGMVLKLREAFEFLYRSAIAVASAPTEVTVLNLWFYFCIFAGACALMEVRKLPPRGRVEA